MTAQDLLNIMEILDAELQLQDGEPDQAKGLIALNVSQDYFETVAAQRPKIFGSSTGTVVTSNGVEFAAYPTGLLRVDRLQLLNSTTNRPKRNLRPLRGAGGYSNTSNWPLSLADSASGEPVAYWTNGTSIYWNPLPSGTYTVRWYGFQRAASLDLELDPQGDLTDFAYDDGVALPIAAFAVRLIKSGLDDDPAAQATLAAETFNPILDTLSSALRDGAAPFEYTQEHFT